MSETQKQKPIKKAKPTIKNIYAFITGSIRYKLYYSKYRKLIRSHILSQIDFRISVMEQACYNAGSCKMCGCTTTALQMASKSCDKPCYPPFMSAKKWAELIAGRLVRIHGNMWRIASREDPINCDYDLISILLNNEVVHQKTIKVRSKNESFQRGNESN